VLKKTITYEDLDGNPVTEDFYFNLTKADLAKMEIGKAGGMQAYLQGIIDAQDGELIIQAFEQILKAAYGVRHEDGKRFIKNDEVWEAFSQTDAYAKLFLEIVTDAEKSAAFVTAIVPSDMANSVAAGIEDANLPEPAQPKKKRPQDMTKAELLAAYQAKNTE
jgi:hypothetical protein